MNTVRAKVTVSQVITSESGESETVYGQARYGDNPEDNTYSKSTPSFSMVMTVTNPEVKGFFKEGQAYYLDFQKVE